MLRHLATKTCQELRELRRVELALEDGLLDALSMRFAHLCNTPKPLPPFGSVSGHIVSNEELHGISPQ